MFNDFESIFFLKIIFKICMHYLKAIEVSNLFEYEMV